jgi:hypothetical protein
LLSLLAQLEHRRNPQVLTQNLAARIARPFGGIHLKKKYTFDRSAAARDMSPTFQRLVGNDDGARRLMIGDTSSGCHLYQRDAD